MDQFDISFLSLTSKPSNGNGRISWPEAPSCRQLFSLPSSIIYYITKNPSTSESYSKMIQSCKYFFEKNPILVAARIYCGGTKVCSKDQHECRKQRCCVKFDITKLSIRIWLTNGISLCSVNIPNFAPLFVPKIYRCEEVQLRFFSQMISLKDFQIFASKFKNIFLDDTKIINIDGSHVMLEKILESIPYVHTFYYYFEKENPAATSSTMKNILKLQNLVHLRKLVFFNIPELMDVKDLDEFIKNHKNTKFWLDLSQRISEKYTNQLDRLIDTIISSEAPNRVIYYEGQDNEKFEIMLSRYNP